jgi:hypothetical protein
MKKISEETANKFGVLLIFALLVYLGPMNWGEVGVEVTFLGMVSIITSILLFLFSGVVLIEVIIPNWGRVTASIWNAIVNSRGGHE